MESQAVGIFWCGYRDAARWFAEMPQISETCYRKDQSPEAEAARTSSRSGEKSDCQIGISLLDCLSLMWGFKNPSAWVVKGGSKSRNALKIPRAHSTYNVSNVLRIPYASSTIFLIGGCSPLIFCIDNPIYLTFAFGSISGWEPRMFLLAK